MTESLEKVRQHYDDVADIYDNRYNRNRGRFYYAHIAGQVMDCIPPSSRILDLGCGTGLFLNAYERRGGSGVGLDLSRGMVLRAQSRCRKSEVTMGNAEVLPFRDGSFDAVTSLLAFSYVRRPDQMLSEACRVLRPGGVIAICTLGRNLFTSGLPAIYSMAEAMKVRRIGMGSFGERYYDDSEMQDLLESAGFDEVQVRRCSFAHLNLADPFFGIARKIEPFVEERVPRLAYNLLARGVKQDGI
ncbi:MAG: methyltransferase domain-containing protein [Methanomicrobiales archaeon]|nr:methyltransferase domain-containing protein [Methanomicrobiales archaeon]